MKRRHSDAARPDALAAAAFTVYSVVRQDVPASPLLVRVVDERRRASCRAAPADVDAAIHSLLIRPGDISTPPMAYTAAPPDPLVTDWLLSALYRRLYFSAETGVLACLEYPAERFGPFVDGHLARPARALAEVLRLAANDAGLGDAAKPLEGL